MKKITFIFILISLLGKAGNPPSIIFKENKGQWPEKVLFGTEFLNTKFYINKTSFNYCVYNAEEMIRSFSKSKDDKNKVVHGHNYEVEFVGADLANFVKTGEQPEYYNYFLGKDQAKWASKVKAFTDLTFNEIYKGADLKLYSNGINLKYDIIVKPTGNPRSIILNYKYADGIELRKGDLIIKTSVGEMVEKRPYAFQVINGIKKEVKCDYILSDKNTVSFYFPEGYDHTIELIIDPTVIVCSYSKATNYASGDACTYDVQGNIFVAAEAYIGYPTTPGAFQLNGHLSTPYGVVDMVISKYNSAGSSRYFSTYIGGDYNDYCLDIKVDNSSIIIFGGSNSLNYPCSSTAYDTTYNSSPSYNYDIIISKLDLTGSSLITSTYIGGAGADALNYFANSVWGWGEGEMEVDNTGNVYVIGSTNSSDFPTTPGAVSSLLQGQSDAFVFKLDNNLSNLVWSTYLGGTGNENGVSVKLDGSGGVYCFGSTTSTNFPVTGGVINPSRIGAGVSADMYITHINASGTVLLASSYLGTASQDYAYLMNRDGNGDLYLFGNFSGSPSLVPTPATYSNPNGCNFIYKINPSLTNLIFRTKFGNYISQVSPYLTFNAAKIDSCGKIYVSGFGANSFQSTSNAFQPYGGGPTDLYMMVFNTNCSSLMFASFFGGPQTNNWTTITQDNPGEATGLADFDNKGCLYTAIGIPGGLPTTANAYNQTVVSTSTWITCNDAFLKADMQTFVNASSFGTNVTGCPPFTTTFVSTTNTGNTFWDLGDGTTSTQDTVSHTYTNLGNYNILLVVTDTSTCNRTDSIKSILNVIPPTTFDLGDDISSCINTKVLIDPDVSAVTYSWSSGQTTSTIMALPGNYTLTINNGGCNSSDDINVVVKEKKLSERFPNVVTANGDHINDFIELKKYDFQEVELIIYDRWGREVFKTIKPDDEWHPDQLNSGTYFWVANYLSNCTGKYATDKGFITIFK